MESENTERNKIIVVSEKMEDAKLIIESMHLIVKKIEIIDIPNHCEVECCPYLQIQFRNNWRAGVTSKESSGCYSP